MDVVIGRSEEVRLLHMIERSGEVELVAIYGRRPVGKTYLIRNGFSQSLDSEFSGSHYATLKQHLESWLQAFDMLEDYLTPLLKKKRRIIFFDEFPWVNMPRSGFLPAFETFWNTWASLQKNLVVVICGSAAAWMIKNVVRNRGGLHNRVGRRMRLQYKSLIPNFSSYPSCFSLLQTRPRIRQRSAGSSQGAIGKHPTSHIPHPNLNYFSLLRRRPRIQ